MAQEPVTLQHPAIGSIKGNRPLPQVEEYLGIQYATLSDRFARGKPVESYPSPLDATSHGPLPVADPQNCDTEQLLLQHPLPHPPYSFSDTACLTLNVTVPSAEVRAAGPSRLPVLVYVHGGGFVTGSANWPQWDLARLVGVSVERGRPIVAVGINYRLGPFGFLTSEAMRSAGYLPNNGLHDQKLALRWVQRHIAGFGGDPAALTYFGCSMGAASGFIHLQSDEPLFNRIAAWGGSGLMQPLPLGVAEVGYGMVVKALGLESLAPMEQVKELVRMPQDLFEAKTRHVPAPYMAWVDGDVVHKVPTYSGIAEPAGLKEEFPGVTWCPTVWMNSCGIDGAIFLVTALAGRKDDLAQALKRCISAALSKHPSTIPALISLYGLDSAATAQEKALAVANFGTDVGFAQAAKATALAWQACTGRAILSHFTCPNPWDGAWKGYPTHVLDSAFALQNYNQFLSAGQRACAERLARDLVDFVTGADKLPWVETNGGTEIVYHADADGTRDESKVVSSEEAANSVARRRELEGIVGGKTEVLDRMMEALGMLLSGQ